MRIPIALVLLAGGIVLLIWGIQASDSAASGFSRFFTGNPTDRTMWLILGGIVAIVAGLGTFAVPQRWFKA